LTDVEGNVATHLQEASGGATKVTMQRAYDPYGAPDDGGTSKEQDAPGSSLGYQRHGGSSVRGVLVYSPDRMLGGVITWSGIAERFRPRTLLRLF
jgi:hypothetical protein